MWVFRFEPIIPATRVLTSSYYLHLKLLPLSSVEYFLRLLRVHVSCKQPSGRRHTGIAEVRVTHEPHERAHLCQRSFFARRVVAGGRPRKLLQLLFPKIRIQSEADTDG